VITDDISDTGVFAVSSDGTGMAQVSKDKSIAHAWLATFAPVAAP